MICRPVLFVTPYAGGCRGRCTEHGPLIMVWAQEEMAALDLLGHAAHFHVG